MNDFNFDPMVSDYLEWAMGDNDPRLLPSDCWEAMWLLGAHIYRGNIGAA